LGSPSHIKDLLQQTRQACGLDLFDERDDKQGSALLLGEGCSVRVFCVWTVVLGLNDVIAGK
jgi:hypothetical protein